MKKFIPSLLILFICQFANSQQTIIYGGNGSTIGAIDTNGRNFQLIHQRPTQAFPGTYMPSHDLSEFVSHPNGKLYSITIDKNGSDRAFLFSYDTITNCIMVLFEFKDDFPIPNPQMTLGPDNNLIYGSCNSGGNDLSNGFIFSFNPATSEIKREIVFGENFNTFFDPNGITRINNNQFLVSFFKGGKKGIGGYLMLDTLGNEIKEMHYGENGNTGGSAVGPLMLHSNGWLYGLRIGSENTGTEFLTRVNPITGYSENVTGGAHGNIYFTQVMSEDILGDQDLVANNQTNLIFGLSTNNNQYTLTHTTNNPGTGTPIYFVEYRDRILIRNNRGYKAGNTGITCSYFDFSNNTYTGMPYTPSNYVPYHTSIEDLNGTIYACTKNGGANSVGHISKFNTSTGKMEIIYDFNLVNGCKPEVLRSYGNILVGIANAGGNNNAGVIFTYDPSTSNYQIIAHLDSTIHGKNPAKELNFISNNTFLYVNTTDGPFNGGSLLKVNLSNGSVQVLKSFEPNNITLKNPYGKMEVVGNNLFGIANNGAVFDKGGIFKYDIANKIISDAYSNSNFDFSNGLAVIDDTLYTLASNKLIAYDASTNTGSQIYDFYNATPSLQLNLGIFISYNKTLFTIGSFNNNRYLVSFNVNNLDTNLRYKFPASYNTNHNFYAQLSVIGNSLLGTTVRVNTTSHAGLFIAFDTISNTVTNTIQLSNLGITTSLYFSARSTPCLYGNKIIGLAGLGGTSPTNYFSSNSYIFEVDLTANTHNLLRKMQENSYNTEYLSLSLFKYNNVLYDIIVKDSMGYAQFLLEILPGGTKNLYPLNIGGSGSQIYASAQADSLLYFITWDGTYEYLNSVNLITKQSQTILNYDYNNFSATNLHFVSNKLIGQGYNLNGEDCLFYYNLQTSTILAVYNDLLLEGITAVSTADSCVYFAVGNNLCKLDVNNGFAKTTLRNLNNGYGVSHYLFDIMWLQKTGGFIYGISHYGSGGLANGPFKYDIVNDSIYSDNSYLGNTIDYTQARIFDGNKFYGMSGSWLYMLDINTGYTRQIYGIGGNKFILINDSTNIDLHVEMQSTCLSSKQVFRVTTNQPNAEFQWYNGNSLLLGENNDTLIITSNTPSAAGYYHCRVSTIYGVAKSDSVLLTTDYCDPVFPGDANSDGIVDAWDIVQLGLGMSYSGLSRTTVSNSFTAFDSNDWNTFAPNNINHKHTDCNGDGTIDFSDTVAVHLNYGLNHGLNLLPTIETNLRAVPIEIQMALTDTLFTPSSNGELNVFTGNINQDVYDVYGLYYEIYYNPDLIEPTSININHNDCWIESPINSENLKIKEHNQSQNKIVGSVMRYDHSDTTGFGSVLKVNYTTTNNSVDTIVWAFRIEKLKLIQHDALFIPITGDSIAQMMDQNSACQIYYEEIADVICEGSNYQLPNGSFTNLAGVYYDTIPATAFCDSIIKTTLTEEIISISLSIVNDTIVVNDESFNSYQWYNCDLYVPVGVTSVFYKPTANGNYSVIVNSNNCSDTSACIFYNLLSVGELNNDIRIYPNPVVDNFIIETKTFPINYSIIDPKGSIVMEGELVDKMNRINLEGVSEGVYYLKIQNDEISFVRQLIYIKK